MRASFESDSNVNDEREKQQRKHILHNTSTEDGMQMDFNALQKQNASLSIPASFKSDSNVTDKREEQS
jgi:hypothetical protein